MADRVLRIVANFQRGATTMHTVCAELIELAGAVGSNAIVTSLPSDLQAVLRQHPLVLRPPLSPDDVFTVESNCGPEPTTDESDRQRREIVHRGAWALHRALHGSK